MPARAAKRPQDFTGQQAEKLAKQRDADAAARADEITMIREAEDEELENTVFDLTAPAAPKEIVPTEIVIKPPNRTVKINSDLENTTFGAGNHYNLRAGGTYKLPTDFADHLDRLGFVWH
jgi:hypothetical protein